MSGEFAIHATGYLSDRLSVRAGACFGCHQFEVEEAYGEFRVSRFLGIRAGRFNVPFGGYAGRDDPSINEASSKPLPYAMGLMPRGREFNFGVVPAPFVDTGAAVTADLHPLSVEAFLVAGLKGGGADLDYVGSRDIGDNNGEPSGGGRIVADLGPLTLGGSAAWGRHDPDSELDYLMLGAEARVSVGPLRLRAEYLRRRTEFLGPAEEEDFLKQGYYVEGSWALDDRWTLYARQDGLAIDGVSLSPFGPTRTFLPGSTDDAVHVIRFTGGVNIRVHTGLILKTSVEYLDFSDFTDTWVFHAGVVFHF